MAAIANYPKLKALNGTSVSISSPGDHKFEYHGVGCLLEALEKNLLPSSF